MTDCLRIDLRDELPRYALDALGPDAAASVRVHLDTCAACQAELVVLQTAQRLATAATPPVDLARIVAAVTAAPRRPIAEPPRAVRTRPRWASRSVLAAAASIVLVLGVALPGWRVGRANGAASPRPDTVASAAGSVPASSVVAVPVEGGLESLSEDDLTALLGALDALEAAPVAEPAAIGTPIVDSPEVM